MQQVHDPKKHHRHSIRLRDYDYTEGGAYFVTICTQNRECFLGEVTNGEMRLNSVGEIVANCWNVIPKHFPNVELDECVVMPNHVHGILVIVDSCVGAQHAAPLRRAPLQRRIDRGGRVNVAPGSLGAIIRSFKSAVTKRINESPNALISNPWQRGYYEHIIRNDRDLSRIRQYLLDNPADWDKDEYNPKLHVS